MIIILTLTIFVALVLGFGITYFVNEGYKTQLELSDWQYWFNSQDFDPNKKKIYLIGSSQVGRLNATYIEEQVSQTKASFVIYNLATNGDEPLKRINLVQEIIDSKPVMVVYGISFLDVIDELRGLGAMIIIKQDPVTDVIGADKPNSILPDPEKFFHKWMNDQTIIDFTNFDISQKNILKIWGLSTEQSRDSVFKLNSPDTPFIKYTKRLNKIIDEKEMKESLNDFQNYGRIFTGYKEGKDVDAMTIKKIITTLKKNNIEVILFSVPIPRGYLDKIDNSDIEIFESVLKEISDEFEVKVYHLYNKYADMDIWYDPIHISMDKTAIGFSSDIAEIILAEIKP